MVRGIYRQSLFILHIFSLEDLPENCIVSYKIWFSAADSTTEDGDDQLYSNTTTTENGVGRHENFIFTSFATFDYSNSSNGKKSNSTTNTEFKLFTRSVVRTTSESKPSRSVKLLGKFHCHLLRHSRKICITRMRVCIKIDHSDNLNCFVFQPHSVNRDCKGFDH